MEISAGSLVIFLKDETEECPQEGDFPDLKNKRKMPSVAAFSPAESYHRYMGRLSKADYRKDYNGIQCSNNNSKR